MWRSPNAKQSLPKCFHMVEYITFLWNKTLLYVKLTSEGNAFVFPWLVGISLHICGFVTLFGLHWCN